MELIDGYRDADCLWVVFWPYITASKIRTK